MLGALFGFAELERYYQREQRWAGVAGLTVTLTVIAAIAVFFRPWINLEGSAHAQEGCSEPGEPLKLT